MRDVLRNAIESAAVRARTSSYHTAMAVELLEPADGSVLAQRDLAGKLAQFPPAVRGLVLVGLAGLEAEAEGDAGIWTDEVRSAQGLQDSGAFGPGADDEEPPPDLAEAAAATERWLAKGERVDALRSKLRGTRDPQEIAALEAELKALSAPPAPKPLADLIPDYMAEEE